MGRFGRIGLRAALAATAALGAASTAAAEPIRVGAGEHAEHSRVVLNLAPPAGWRARAVPGGVEIVLPGVADPFIDDAVTERRRAHRVETFSVRREGGASVVTLGFNCACDADAYALGAQGVVIDVRDGAPEPIAAQDAAERGASSETVALDDGAAEGVALDDGAAEGVALDDGPAEGVASDDGPAEGVALDDGAAEGVALDDGAAALDAAAAAEGEALDPEIERARAMFIETLRKAEAEGLISFQPGSPAAIEAAERAAAEAAERAAEQAAAEAEAAAEKAAAQEAAAAAAAAEAAMAQGGAAATGAKTPAETGAGAPFLETADAADGSTDAMAGAPIAPPGFEMAPVSPCVEDAALELASGAEDAFFETLASKRSMVFDEINRVDPAAVIDLAKHYLSAGLGVEAAAIPQSFGVDTTESRIVVAMADVIERKAPLFGGPFARSEPCPGRHGLWQAAALADLDPVRAAAAFAETGRALARTPEPLRRMLGARIGRALTAAGAFDEARAIHKLLSRSHDAPTVEMLLLEAEIAIDEGRDIAARAALRRASATRDPLAVVALTRLSELLEPESDARRMPAIATRLGDAATAWRGDPYGEALVAAEAKLRARFGDLTGAIGAIDARQARLEAPSDRLAALRTALIETEITEIAMTGDAARVAAAVEVVRAGPLTAEGARLRLLLGEALITASASHLVPLVLSEELQAADPRAAEIAIRAAADADLYGAPPVYAAAPATDADPDASRPGGPIETADAPTPAGAEEPAFADLRERAFAAFLGAPEHRDLVLAELERSEHPEAAALISLLASETEAPAFASDTVVHTPAALEGGRALLENLDAELALMKEIAGDG